VYTEQVMSGNLVCQVFVLFKGGYNLQFIDKMVRKKVQLRSPLMPLYLIMRLVRFS
jgi:hypothetical protein